MADLVTSHSTSDGAGGEVYVDTYAAERDRVRAVRMQLLEHHPFWAYLLLQMTMVFDDTLPAYAATDCLRHIWLNPQRTASLSLGQLGFVLVHEVAHQVHAVDARQQGRTPQLWHQAVDYAINRIVAAIPHPWQDAPLYEPPPDILLDHAFDRLVAESIYERLVQRAMPVVPGGESGAARMTSGPPALRAEEGQPAERAAVGRPALRTASGHPLEEFGGGLDLHVPVVDNVEVREQLEDRLRAAVAQYEAEGARGDMPGDLSRRFARREARVPWRRLLRQYANQVLARDEYDPRRPNRRWASEGFLVPGLGGERVGHIVVAIDTSGSMKTEDMEAALAEVRAIADASTEVTVIVADADVNEVVALDAVDPWLARGEMTGGGGTDHRPVFNAITDHRLQPDLFIGITDLHSVFPDRAPTYPVLWVAPAGHGTAPWGRVVGMG